MARTKKGSLKIFGDGECDVKLSLEVFLSTLGIDG